MSTPSQPPPAEASAADPGLKIWSCVNCRRRKLKCERRDPCSNCVKRHIECHYPVTGRLPRRSRDPAACRSPAQKQTELLGRLRRLEAVVTELTGQMEDSTLISHLPSMMAAARAEREGQLAERQGDSSLVWQAQSDPNEDFGNLVTDEDGSLRVARGFWSIFCDEVDHIFQAVQDVADDNGTDTSDSWSDVAGSLRSHHQGFVLGTKIASDARADLSPLPSQMMFIWQTFIQNFDPFIKVLHVPTTDKFVRAIDGRISALDPEHEALMFAISLAAIVTMDDGDASTSFGVPRAQLLARYRLGTEQALARAEFLVSKSMTTLAAFIIYLAVLPQLEARQLSWPLTGLLVRIATSIGLHRDPTSLSEVAGQSTHCDVEQWRRTWWHVCFLDSRARCQNAPDLSLAKVAASTRLPTNLNDAELDNTAPQVREQDQEGITDTTLCRIRCELWLLNKTLQETASSGFDAQLQVILATHSRLHSTYFQAPNQDNHFHAFLQTMVSLLFANIELAIFHRYSNSSSSSSKPRSHRLHPDEVLRAATTVLESAISLKTEGKWKRWRWQLQGNAPWQALAASVTFVRYRAWDDLSERAWRATASIMNSLQPGAKELPTAQRIAKDMALMQKIRGDLGLASTGAVHQDGQGQPLSELQELNLDGEVLQEPSAHVFQHNLVAAGASGSHHQWSVPNTDLRQDLQPLADTSAGAENFGFGTDPLFSSDGNYMADLGMSWQGWDDMTDATPFWNWDE